MKLRRWLAIVTSLLAASCGSGSGGEATNTPPVLPTLLVFAGDPTAAAETRDGQGAAARFDGVSRLAVDGGGSIYAQQSSGARKIAPDAQVTTLLNDPVTRFHGIAVKPDGQVVLGRTYVCLTCQGLFPPVQLAPGGALTILPMSTTSDGSAWVDVSMTEFAVDNQGAVLMSGGPAILRADSTGNVTTVSRSVPPSWIAGAMTLDPQGNIYFIDSGANAVKKLARDGVVSTVAGGTRGARDGVGADAQFDSPQAIAVGPDNLIWVADTGNHAVRRIDSAGKVTTVIGQLSRKGFAPGALPGGLESPTGLVIIGRDLYIAMQWGIAVVRQAAY